MNKHFRFLFLIIFLLPLFSISPSYAQESISLNVDKSIVAPGETIYFILTANFNETVIFEIWFKSYLVENQFFVNLSISPGGYLWTVPGIAQNGTYSAFAYASHDHNLNASLVFDVYRDDVVLLFRNPFWLLSANLTFENIYGRKQKKWTVNVTNIFTHDSMIREIENYNCSISPLEADTILYGLGHAIMIHAWNDLYEKTIIVAAGLDVIEQNIVGNFKRTLKRTVTTLVVVIVFFFIVSIIIYVSRKNANKRASTTPRPILKGSDNKSHLFLEMDPERILIEKDRTPEEKLANWILKTKKKTRSFVKYAFLAIIAVGVIYLLIQTML